MKGKKIKIKLNTPIIIEVPLEGSKDKIKSEAVVLVQGVLSELGPAGVEVEVGDLYNERNHSVPFPGARLFLPYHKIDHFFSGT